VASADGRGFVVPEDEVVAQTKSGKQVLNLGSGLEAAACARVAGDSVAVIGENRKLLIFPLSELPVMTRGRGVILQRYRDGGLKDIKTFALKEGLTWQAGGGRTRTETDLTAWIGKRSAAGARPAGCRPTASPSRTDSADPGLFAAAVLRAGSDQDNIALAQWPHSPPSSVRSTASTTRWGGASPGSPWPWC
jgi:DNA gyrase/topoisomerase IV subunit A